MFAGCVSSNMVTEELPTESATESTTQPAHKTEVPEGYVGIYSADDFEYIRTTPKGNYILMSDLDFSDVKDWKNIKVEGDFDGNNYSVNNYNQNEALFYKCSGSIKDLTMSNSSCKNGSPFCNSLYAKGTLTNIKINANISTELTSIEGEEKKYDPSVYIGGIVNTAERDSNDNEPAIASCLFNGNIEVNFKQIIDLKEQEVNVGGIVGYSDHCHVSNCIATGNITYNEQGDDIIFHNTFLGGIIAYSTVSEVYNSAANMNIKASTISSVWAGGIIGISKIIGGGPKIVQCCNSGDIELNSRDSDECQAGGICAKTDSYKPVIKDCYNSGNIAAHDVAGISVNSAVISKCYNRGNLNGSKATGSLLIDKSESVEYSYYLDEGFPAIYNGGKYPTVKALTSEAMQNKESYEGFDFENVWTMGSDNYPAQIYTQTN